MILCQRFRRTICNGTIAVILSFFKFDLLESFLCYVSNEFNSVLPGD